MRVLIAEDDSRVASALAQDLESEGFAVDRAATADEALVNARVYPYDAMIINAALPDQDGVSVCRTLRNQGLWSPVLLLGLRWNAADRIGALDAGADDVVTRPCDVGELAARLRALLRRGAPERPAVLRAGDVVVDPALHTVVRSGRPVRLTPREFSLLEFLVRRRGEVVTRATILDHVWDRNYAGSGNVVDVYVSYLRRKVERPFGRPLIRTVRGVGYVVDG